MVDLRKAYHSVYRKLLIRILRERAETPLDKSVVDLIESLTRENKILYNGHAISERKGVIQGGTLSPRLFNFYLDHALRNDPILSKLIEIGHLYAFAVDILIKMQW
jgi:hypothetical protein